MSFYNLNSNLKKTFLSIVILLAIVIVGNKALLADVVYESDDYLHHAGRTANYYLALRQGQMPVRWAPNLNSSYGYPSFNYIYHTPYAVGSILHFLNFSIQQSINLAVLLSILAGAVFCFFLVRSYKTSNAWSVILSLWFVFNPYTLLSIYWRGAVGELWFYGFVPLLLLSVRKMILLKNLNIKPTTFVYKLWFAVSSLTTALLVLSHLPSVIILLPVLLVFTFTQLNKKLNINILKPIILSGILGLLISSWYWIPAYFEQWMITYESGSSLLQHTSQFVSPFSIFNIFRNFNTSSSFLSVVQIGGLSFFAILIGFYYLKITDTFTHTKKAVVSWLSLIFISVLFLSGYSKILWDNSQLLQYIQYPWRTLWIITLSSIMILTLFLKELTNSKLEKKLLPIKNNIKIILMSISILGIIFSTQAYTYTKGSSSRTDYDWYQTFATGSSFDEHRPVWSKTPYYFPEELLFVNASASAGINSSNLEQNIEKLSKLNAEVIEFNGTTIKYSVSPSQDIMVIHKRLFYPGWEAYLDGKKIDFEQNLTEYEGVLAVKVPAKETLVEIKFTGYTKLRNIFEIVSIISLFGLLTFILKKKI